MKLWLIKRSGEIGYDEYEGHVIAAESEAQARSLANERAGDWGEGKIWFNAGVSCVVIGYPLEGQAAAIILSSFNAG